jgi:RHS repeat-associated protein
MKHGKVDKYIFDGGYAQASVASTTTDNFAFYFYNQDHLGNNREVVDAGGNIQQVTNYYPFGATYFDDSAVKSSDYQPYKFNGKEFDKMNGLNTYDYGARQHDPILARWDRIDPLAEKYYHISPYAYCANNPVILVDPDGRSLASKGGRFLLNVGKSVSKNGLKALNKVDTYTSAFKEIKEDFNTLMDENASTWDRVKAGVSLASEILSPVSLSDAKDAKKIVKKISNKGRPGTVIAKENGITIKTYGTNDAHKPAHAHVIGKGSEVRVGPNGKPLKGQPELSTQQKKVVDNHRKALRKEVKALGKENKKLEEK